MNCDQVFAILTSGPFPRGVPEDAVVEQHLAVCPSCWRIAEALRPDEEIGEEALPAVEIRSLPRYGVPLVTPQKALATSRGFGGQAGLPNPGAASATQVEHGYLLAESRHQDPANHRWHELVRSAACMAVIAVMAFLAGWWFG